MGFQRWQITPASLSTRAIEVPNPLASERMERCEVLSMRNCQGDQRRKQ
jgi:hypothetical protein